MLQRAPKADAGRFSALLEHGQSPWLDFINRTHTEDGSLRKMVEQDGLHGMTSNPAIFEKTMGHGNAYDPQIRKILAARRVTAGELYEELAVADIRAAADILRPVFDATDGADGHVSLEVSPLLAHDADGTIAEARRLWNTVDVANLMIKIPGTAAGAKAIEQVTSEGINVNVTLLFAQDAYHAVLEAYLRGLERRLDAGHGIERIASVASFYIGRVDLLVDELIDGQIAKGHADTAALKALRGHVAISNGKLAYQHWEETMASARWKKIAAAGGATQRILWASTSTKDKTYPELVYVEELVAPETVNTMPLPTYDAFREHGTVRHEMGRDYGQARHVIDSLATFSIDLRAVTDKLLRDGLSGFDEAWDSLHKSLDRKIATLG